MMNSRDNESHVLLQEKQDQETQSETISSFHWEKHFICFIDWTVKMGTYPCGEQKEGMHSSNTAHTFILCCSSFTP